MPLLAHNQLHDQPLDRYRRLAGILPVPLCTFGAVDNPVWEGKIHRFGAVVSVRESAMVGLRKRNHELTRVVDNFMNGGAMGPEYSWADHGSQRVAVRVQQSAHGSQSALSGAWWPECDGQSTETGEAQKREHASESAVGEARQPGSNRQR